MPKWRNYLLRSSRNKPNSSQLEGALTMSEPVKNTHSVAVGYLLWIFGFLGAHRFYYGKPVTGALWFGTLGLLGVGWLIDVFLIPSMDAKADRKYVQGPLDYNLVWAALTFFGVFGVHRFIMGKWLSGIVYFFTFGLFFFGILYDFFTLNDQIDTYNRKSSFERVGPTGTSLRPQV